MRARLALIATACAGLWTTAAAHGTDLPGAQASRLVGSPHRPIYCDFITRFKADYLADLQELPIAFNVDVGEVAPGEAAPFRFFALTDDPRFYSNVTIEHRAISARVRVPVGGEEVGGVLRYGKGFSHPWIDFVPNRTTVQDRVAFVEFGYHCRRPKETYTTRFLLTLRGTGRSPAEGAERGISPDPEVSDRFVGVLAQLVPRGASEAEPCTDLAVSLQVTTPQVQDYEEYEFRVEVKNLGPEPVANPIVRLPGTWRYLRNLQASQGSAYLDTWRGPLIFAPRTLEPGASATLTVRDRASEPGTYRPSAALDPLTADCNSANNQAQGTVLVLRKPRPQLVGTDLQGRLTWSGLGNRVRHALRGSIRVQNVGEVAVGPTRMILFLSDDRTSGPEDRLLGFADVAALPAGGATTIDLSYDFEAAPRPRKHYLIALVESSNSEWEHDEHAHWVVSPPLP